MFGGRKQPEQFYVEWIVWTDNQTGPDAWTDDIRRIVREELAELVPVDVPDAPPEDDLR